MATIYGNELKIEEAKRKIASLEKELSSLYLLKSEMAEGADAMQGQITSKRTMANNLLTMEARLPLVKGINNKVQTKIDETFKNNMLLKFDDAKKEVNAAILKVNNEIEEQKDIIDSCNAQIKSIQEEKSTNAKN